MCDIKHDVHVQHVKAYKNNVIQWNKERRSISAGELRQM